MQCVWNKDTIKVSDWFGSKKCGVLDHKINAWKWCSLQISIGWIDLFDDNMENIVDTYRILIKIVDDTHRIGSVKRYRVLIECDLEICVGQSYWGNWMHYLSYKQMRSAIHDYSSKGLWKSLEIFTEKSQLFTEKYKETWLNLSLFL